MGRVGLPKILVIGLGISGSTVAQYMYDQQKEVFCFDDSEEKLLVAEQKGWKTIRCIEDIPTDLEECFCSPGISYDHRIRIAIAEKGIPISSEFKLGATLLSQKKKLCLGITGANGKTTTTLFTTHLLNSAGKSALAVGNIGKTILSALDVPEEVLVVEVSSFQLEDMHREELFQAATILNITPDHLDRHKTFQAYAEAKKKIEECLCKGAFVYSDAAVADLFPEQGYSLLSEKRDFVERCLSYEGLLESTFAHDIDNYCAGVCLASAILPISEEIFRQAVKTFQRPSHRMEFVRDFKGIKYFNDSKGTNVGAVIKAVDVLSENIILIVGGLGKGVDFSLWKSPFHSKVKAIFAIGEAADDIYRALSPEYDISCVGDLKMAIDAASAIACKGDTVLLSPGCASFDQFKGYEHRGNCFKEWVTALK